MNLLTFVTIFLVNKFTMQQDTLKVLHLSGFHAKFEPVINKITQKSEYGIARIVHYVKEQKDRFASTIFIDAMDWFKGSIWYSVHKGNICAEFLKLLPVDAIGLGDEETNTGKTPQQRTKNFTNYMLALNDKAVVCANCELPVTSPVYNIVKKSVTLDVQDVSGKVGVTAFVHRSLVWKFDDNGLTITNEFQAVQREVDEMTRNGVKIIIVIAHAHSAFNTAITKRLQNVDLVVGGHSHRLLYNASKTPNGEPHSGPYPQVVKAKDGTDVPIVYCGCYGHYVGDINLRLDSEGNVRGWTGGPAHMGNEVEEDEQAKQLLEEFRPAVRKERQKVLAKCKVYLNNSCYWEECNFGNFVADAYVDYFTEEYGKRHRFWTDKPIALLRSHFLVADIDTKQDTEYAMTVAHVLAAIPADESLHCVKLNGSLLKTVLEHAVSDIEDETSPRFLQMSGLHVTYDLNRKINDRVVKLTARCGECDIPKYKEVEDTEHYNVIIGYQLATGDDDFDMLGAIYSTKNKLEISSIDTIKAYTSRKNVIYTGIEERIKIIYRKYQMRALKTSGAIRRRPWCSSFVFCIFVYAIFLRL